MKHPWTIIRGKSPLIATAIHNGHDIREELTELHAIDEETRQREEDFYTGEWTTVADTRVILHQSRFEVDMNRTHEKAVYIKPSDAWGLQIWKVKPPIDVINRSLELYNSFYNELFHLLSDTIKQCGRFVLLDIHSYRHRRESPDAEFDPIANNPEVIVGTGNMDRSFWTPVVDTFIMDLRKFNFMGRNLDVRENVKFPGGHFSRWVHNTFPGQGCALAIEFKKFYMNEWTGQPYREQIDEIKRALSCTIPGILKALSIVNRQLTIDK